MKSFMRFSRRTVANTFQRGGQGINLTNSMAGTEAPVMNSRLLLAPAAALAIYCAHNLNKETYHGEKKEDQSSLSNDPFIRTKKKQALRHKYDEYLNKDEAEEAKAKELIILGGNANSSLSKEIGEDLGMSLGEMQIDRFSDGEVHIQIDENIFGKDVYVVQPTCPPVNENLIELLLMISTCRRHGARKITAVMPYYGYARQDRKMSARVPISAADCARLLEAAGVDRVIAIDLHCGQIQGFFGPRVPCDNLVGTKVGIDYFTSPAVWNDLKDPVVVSPDAGGVYRAKKMQEAMINKTHNTEIGLAMIIKQRVTAGKIARMDLIGQVEGSDVILIDDMIDTAGTLCEAANELKRRGARRVFAYATHGLFSGPACDRIQRSALEKVIVTNTINHSSDVVERSGNKIQVESVAVLLAEAIRRIHHKESVSVLFGEK